MLNVTMHGEAFQMLTMRFVCSSGVDTCIFPSNIVQYSRSSSNASSAFAGCRYFASAFFADVLLMICEPGGSNLSSLRFSWYPSIKTICLDSPGFKLTLTCWAPIGCHPCAMDLQDSPFSTTIGSFQPRYEPRKVSRTVSKPASSSEDAK